MKASVSCNKPPLDRPISKGNPARYWATSELYLHIKLYDIPRIFAKFVNALKSASSPTLHCRGKLLFSSTAGKKHEQALCAFPVHQGWLIT
ncbi:hypothetical protein HDN1F_04200 [gamma proteobacterium HdN1]|nr:hypothetical protein HDN1F_04200 [gamma proteobacterium HdN1]